MDTKQQKNSKTIARMQMLVRRKKQNADFVAEASEKIMQKVLLHPDVQKAKTLFVYVSFGNEVATHELITKLLAQGKTVCVPKIVNEDMIAVQIRALLELRPGYNRILEPVHNEEYEGAIDCALVPGVAFTKEGMRLGMGGGFYDIFLHGRKKIRTIALAFGFQVVPTVPTEDHDRSMDTIITEAAIFPHK